MTTPLDLASLRAGNLRDQAVFDQTAPWWKCPGCNPPSDLVTLDADYARRLFFEIIPALVAACESKEATP